MKTNSIKKLNVLVSLLDNHILKELNKSEFDEEKLEKLSRIRTEFVQELNNLINIENTRDMYKSKN